MKRFIRITWDSEKAWVTFVQSALLLKKWLHKQSVQNTYALSIDHIAFQKPFRNNTFLQSFIKKDDFILKLKIILKWHEIPVR